MSLSTYPSNIDTFSNHSDTTNETITAAHMNKVQDCVVAIENVVDSHKALTITAHGGLTPDYDGDFLSLIQKNYKNIALAYSYNDDGLLGGATITGLVSGTITYNYTSGLLSSEIIAITSPYVKTLTTIYGYDDYGRIETETRTVS